MAHRTPGAAWTSAAVLLHPLPEAALPSFLHVLRDVPHSLAEPFIRHELSRHGISAEPHDASAENSRNDTNAAEEQQKQQHKAAKATAQH